MDWQNFSLRTIIISLLIALVGMTLIAISFVWQPNEIVVFSVGSLGTTAFTIGVISFLYEVLLRKSFVEVLEGKLTEVLLKEETTFINKFETNFKNDKQELLDAFNKELSHTIAESVPAKYQNIKRVGIVDAYDFLELEKLRQKIERLENTEFKILKMWTPTLNLLESNIIQAIEERNVLFKINLLSPNAKEAIAKRASSLKDYDSEQIVMEIIKNLRRCKSIYKRINNKSNLQVRLYDTFISIPLYGYGTSYIMGLYLHNRLSEEGVQIKVSSVGSKLFKKLDEHFNSVWDVSQIIDFESENYLTNLISDSATNNAGC